MNVSTDRRRDEVVVRMDPAEASDLADLLAVSSPRPEGSLAALVDLLRASADRLMGPPHA